MAAERIEELTGISGETQLRLTRLPPIGFWSYSRQDDDLSKGKLSNLRGLLMSEIQQQYGRERVHLFQDVGAIPHGARWEREIRNALENSTFFIPIITPNFIQSEWCCQEVEIFLQREDRLFEAYPDLPRRSRIFPIQLIDITDADPHDPQVLTALEQLQWFDFRRMRHESLDDVLVQRSLSEFAGSIRELLYARVRPPATKEDRQLQAREAAAAQAREEEAATALRLRQDEERRQSEAAHAQAEAARVEEEQRALEAQAETARLAAERADAQRLVAAERAERQRLAKRAVAAGRTQRGPLTRRIAIGTIATSILVIGAVLILSLRDRDEADVDIAAAQPLPIQRRTATPAMPAPASGPTHQWLLGRWGIAGSCRSPRTIRSEGNRITIALAGGRQIETIMRADAQRVITDITTYTRDGAAVSANERAINFQYRMTPCPG